MKIWERECESWKTQINMKRRMQLLYSILNCNPPQTIAIGHTILGKKKHISVLKSCKAKSMRSMCVRNCKWYSYKKCRRTQLRDTAGHQNIPTLSPYKNDLITSIQWNQWTEAQQVRNTYKNWVECGNFGAQWRLTGDETSQLSKHLIIVGQYSHSIHMAAHLLS